MLSEFDALGLGLTGLRFVATGCELPDQSTNHTAGNWGHNEQPELSKSGSTLEKGWAERASGVDAGVGDRNANEVDQRQHQADANSCLRL